MLDDTNRWRYVRPEPGHAIVNLGDSMVQWIGGVPRSNMHRVVPPAGAQSEYPRYSIAYVLNPPYACRMERLKGEGIPLGEGAEERLERMRSSMLRRARGFGRGKIWSVAEEEEEEEEAEARRWRKG